MGDTQMLAEGFWTLEEIVHLDGYAPNSNTIESMEDNEGYER